ncbi:hypothetical protein ACFX2C_040814 [Malus domestica]
MCGVCQQAPAAVTCKADAAALCVSCDTDIHSANPIARRHEWVPVEPFYDAAESIVVKSTTGPSSAAAALNYLVPNGDVVFNTKDIENNAASSWLIPNPNFNSKLSATPPATHGVHTHVKKSYPAAYQDPAQNVERSHCATTMEPINGR